MKKTNPILFALLAVLLLGAPLAYAEDSSVKGRGFLGINFFNRTHSEDDTKDENETEDKNDDTNEDKNDDKRRDERRGVDIRTDIKANVDLNSRDRAVAEIDRRIESLNKLETRIDAMKRVSASSKTSIKATIDGQITILTDLKAKIIADTDEATLKADIASISKSYRIYMLVMPQVMILATAERINMTADLMTDFGAKLETRINEADTAGHDVATLESAYSDYKAKIADAKVQAAAAVTLTATLKPDNGDQAVMQANLKAMNDARAKLKAARADFEAARKDAQTIVKGLKSFDIKLEGNFKSDSKAEDNR